METIVLILAAALAVSEALAQIDAVESNSIFQMVRNVLKKAKEVLEKK